MILQLLYFGLLSSPCLFITSGAFLEFGGNYGLFIRNFLSDISAPKRLVHFYCKEGTTAIFPRKYPETDCLVARIDISMEVPDDLLELDRVVFIIDLRCRNLRHVLNKANENKLFRKSNIWMFFGNLNLINSDAYFSKYSRTFLFNATETHLQIYNFFKITIYSSFSLELVYKWSLINNSVTYLNNKTNGKVNFMQKPIQVSYALIYNESINHLTDYRYRQHDQPSKITYVLMEQICAIFNATHLPIFRAHWGDYDFKTKTFTPDTMFSDLQFGMADIAGNTAAITVERLHHLRYLALTGTFNLNTLLWFFKAPPLSYTRNVWILPFMKHVWYVTFLVVILWYIMIVRVAICEQNLKGKKRFNGRNCWFVALDIVIATLTQRGTDITFSTWSGRIICYSLFILIVLLNIAYTANFLVLLQSTSNNIKNFEDVLNTRMLLGSLNESYNMYYFMHPSDLLEERLRRKVWSLILKWQDRFWLNAAEGIQKVKEGLFAYHVQSSVGYDQIDKTYDEATKRSIRVVDGVIRYHTYLCVAKNSTLEDYLSYGFSVLKETGIAHREQQRLFPQKPSPDYTKAIFSSFDINDLSFVLQILAVGLILSVFVLILEKIHFRLAKTHTMRLALLKNPRIGIINARNC